MVALVDARNFVRSIRETGYRSLAHSIAEFIDNSLQALATTVTITVSAENGGTISIADDGAGMGRNDLRTALQFGGSTRFNDRTGLGRFGMGLPTSSVSLAKRVDVYTWKNSAHVLRSHLDIDELESSASVSLPEPRKIPRPPFLPATGQGTMVVLSRCDRTGKLSEPRYLDQTIFELRRIFRWHLKRSLRLFVNGAMLEPFDPLFLSATHLGVSATPYGPELEYNVPVADHSSSIRVRFSELPVGAWRGLSNIEKQALGVSRGAGVSIVRCDREIAYGWYFFGSKRRENYDDWWRCEVVFNPELDEIFGVNHTKQQISPSAGLERLLTPDMESIARVLNVRVRQEFVRTAQPKPQTVARAASVRDKYLPNLMTPLNTPVRNPEYRIEVGKDCGETAFFRAELSGARVSVWLNPRHPVTAAYLDAKAKSGGEVPLFEYAILSAARAELAASTLKQRWWFRNFRSEWSDALATFLGN